MCLENMSLLTPEVQCSYKIPVKLTATGSRYFQYFTFATLEIETLFMTLYCKSNPESWHSLETKQTPWKHFQL